VTESRAAPGDVGPELDAARARVIDRGLVTEAVAELTPLVVGLGLSLEALAPVKSLQKRFFADGPWTHDDDQALAAAIGTGPEGMFRHDFEPGLTLWWGWDGGQFRLRVTSDEPAVPHEDEGMSSDIEVGAMFDGAVAPEATPSPRTIRFATPVLHDGHSRGYTSATADADRRVARLFHEFSDVTDVLVGPDFVAVTLARPDRWELVLGPMLRAVTEEFAGQQADSEGPDATRSEPPAVLTLGSSEVNVDALYETPGRPSRRSERAWAELGTLRVDRPEGLDRVVAAARDPEPARRQVAAVLLAEAPADVAAPIWSRLLDDPSRMVRRSVVDAVVGTRREMHRPLLEHAVDDPDAWIRWKALRGIAELGMEPSRTVVEARAEDTDIRVRLEAVRALRTQRG
jgi:HEAT repeats/Scaffold protein Nfu/NifU N terminal